MMKEKQGAQPDAPKENGQGVVDTKSVLMQYVPEDQPNKEQYVSLVQSQILGVDNRGKNRPMVDLLYFLSVSKRTNLDPLARQVFAVYRWDSRTGKDKMTIQTSIDGLRLIAQRSNLYGGQDDTKFLPEDESTSHPIKATVTVYRINSKTGERMPITASARWDEYKQTTKAGQLMGMWAKMPYNQLAKCAEALALRKGFSQELSGLYSEDEMGQASNGTATNKLDELDLKPPVKKEENAHEVDNNNHTHQTTDNEVKIVEAKVVEEKSAKFPCTKCGKEMTSGEVDRCDTAGIKHICTDCLEPEKKAPEVVDPVAARNKLKKQKNGKEKK